MNKLEQRRDRNRRLRRLESDAEIRALHHAALKLIGAGVPGEVALSYVIWPTVEMRQAVKRAA